MKFQPMLLEKRRLELNDQAKKRKDHHEKKLTLERAAELTGFSKSKIQRWENGDANPKVDELAIIAKCYGVDVSYFLAE